MSTTCVLFLFFSCCFSSLVFVHPPRLRVTDWMYAKTCVLFIRLGIIECHTIAFKAYTVTFTRTHSHYIRFGFFAYNWFCRLFLSAFYYFSSFSHRAIDESKCVCAVFSSCIPFLLLLCFFLNLICRPTVGMYHMDNRCRHVAKIWDYINCWAKRVFFALMDYGHLECRHAFQLHY